MTKEMARGRRWSDLTDRQQTAVLVAVSVQLSLAATAWVDLARRPAAEVNGRKSVWAAITLVNFVGPLAYFRWGRKPGAEVSSRSVWPPGSSAR